MQTINIKAVKRRRGLFLSVLCGRMYGADGDSYGIGKFEFIETLPFQALFLMYMNPFFSLCCFSSRFNL